MPSFSFKKEERIRRRSEFIRITKEGKKYYSPHFRVWISPNQLPYRRLGIVVSKKVGSAVKRNRLKRLIREFFRLHKEEFFKSSDFVIQAKEGADQLNFWEVAAELHAILKEN